ncbi:MAG TPA: succinylglutamate desuccinylase/aspartoacylase family protein [Bacteroidetes bacterium]|nr:succinylglutamate desuccinylase/aspartoacylase family protein [Bacteroidota bacterium]
MIINKQTIGPGEKKTIRITVGRLPSDTRIDLYVHVNRSQKKGPVLLLMAGIHGDEINGVEIIRRYVAQSKNEELLCGSVIAIPVLNIYGFNNFSRDVPDGKDVNRSFPGSARGSLASRVARLFTKNILPLIDFGIDFHTGGQNHFNYPQIRYTTGHSESLQLAKAFAAPFTIAAKPIPRSLRRVAVDAGKPVIVFEGGENRRFDGYCIAKGLAGTQRVMAAYGMAAGAMPVSDESIFISSRTWVRAKRPGMFRWWKQSGQKVVRGEPMGVINDPYGKEEHHVVSPRNGYIIGHNNAPVVGQGDALFHIGERMKEGEE